MMAPVFLVITNIEATGLDETVRCGLHERYKLTGLPRLPIVAREVAEEKDLQEKHAGLRKRHRELLWLAVLALIALMIQSGLLLLALFGPALPYLVTNPQDNDLDSDQFIRSLAAITGSNPTRNARIQVLENGEHFYQAELEAIRSAQKSVCLEAYIFQDGEIGSRIQNALAERARAGVAVHVVLDAIGSASLTDKEVKRIPDSGAHLAWYHPLRWYTWPRINNRTHRELLVVDGKIGFIGGAGIADQWQKTIEGQPRWRDTMVRVEGPAVSDLQGTFTENWLEAAGAVLTGERYFPEIPHGGGTLALAIKSSPTEGRSTPARVLFQTLIASARRTIHIATPYFLPDDSLRDEITRAIRRGVSVEIIVPGQGSDHILTRTSSRHLYGEILKANGRIYEYQPTMIHAKVLIVDSLWSVVGSTNMDPRSFSLNDEVNLAIRDKTVAGELEQGFERDRAQSRSVSYQQWRSRPVWERLTEFIGSLVEREQ
jgi:cardiolipin synthase